MNDRRDGGFTLVEIAIVVVLLSTIMGAVWSTSTRVNETVETNSRAADVLSLTRSTLRRVAKFVRPGKLSTIEMQAVAADLTAVPPLAPLATAIGEWIDPSDLVWRPGIRFLSSTGTESMNAALSTKPRELTFALDPGEIDNGIDDDGDGLIDEGTLRLKHDNVTIAVVNDVEECGFMLDGRLLSIRLRCGVPYSRGAIRAETTQAFYLRNN